MQRPLFHPANVIVRHMAARVLPCGFDVADHAPDTFAGLATHMAATGRMLVWAGASNATIFADPTVNHAFRGWHDWTHWRNAFGFSPEGEAATCEAQIRDVFNAYGDNAITRRVAAILRAEINGQVKHIARFGRFPADQFGFTAAYLRDGGLTVPF